MDITSTDNRADSIYLSTDSLGTTDAVFIGANAVGGSNGIYAFSQIDGTPQIAILNSVSGSRANKYAFSYKENDFALSINGNAIGSDTSGSMTPNLTTMYIGSREGTNQYINGHIRKVAYYDQQLTDLELRALTEND